MEIEVWGKQGELVAKYLKKESPVMIEGHWGFDPGELHGIWTRVLTRFRSSETGTGECRGTLVGPQESEPTGASGRARYGEAVPLPHSFQSDIP